MPFINAINKITVKQFSRPQSSCLRLDNEDNVKTFAWKNICTLLISVYSMINNGKQLIW